jgi:glucokinase
MRVLAGDIGGTKTAVAIVEADAGKLALKRQRVYRSAGYKSLDEILIEFLDGVERIPSVACFGVAGPVVAGKATVTKLPWTIDERALTRALDIPTVRVINDFVAAAAGLSYLRPRQLRTLAAGEPESRGPIALIGAGTGLGQAGLVWAGGHYEPLPSEGGHADLAARDSREDRFIGFLRDRFGRATRDRVLSGGGLTYLYDFLKENRFAPERAAVARAFAREDKAAVISRLALARRDRLSEEALRMFLSIYGSEAGNLALQYRATGGIYVGGGIATRILPAFRSSQFLDSFVRKPPMEPLLARVPIHIVADPRLGLLGAAASAYWTAIEMTRFSSRTRVRPRRR